MKKHLLILLGTTALSFSSHGALTAYWDFEAGTGSPQDSVSATPGTFNGNTAWTGSTGGEGTASTNSISNDGSLESFFDSNVTGVGASLTGSNAKTITAWVRSPGAGAWGTARNGIFSYSPSSGNGAGEDLRLLYDSDAGGLRFEVNSGFAANNTNLDDGSWHMIGVVIEANDGVQDVQLFIDGSFVANTTQSGGNTLINTASTTVNAAPGQGNLDIVIAGDHRTDNPGDGINALNGFVDGVRIYDTALDITELNALYTIPEPATYTVLIGLVSAVMVLRRRRS